MTPLLVVLPYHNGDVDLAKMLLEHIASFPNRPDPRHSILLVADSGVDPVKTSELMGLVKKVFHTGADIRLTITATGWPKAANQMFLLASRAIRENYKLPFLWLEPDCVPLSADWLDKLSAEYEVCPKRFLGCIVENKDQAGLPPFHLTGCSIYPNDAYDVLEAHCTGEAAFDIASAGDVVNRGRARNTKLIAHMWGLRDLPPTFVTERTADSPKNALTLDQIPNGAVLWHRCKDGTLISVLRKSSEAKRLLSKEQGDVYHERELRGKTLFVQGEQVNLVPNGGKKQSVAERMASLRSKRKPKAPANT